MRILMAFVLASVVGGKALPGVKGTLTGSVVSSSPRELVLRDDKGADHALAVDSPAMTPPAGVVVGTRVTVSFQELEDGTSRLVAVDTWGAMDTTPMEDQPAAQSSVPDVALTGAIPMSMLLATLVLGGAVALAAIALRWTRRAI